MTAGLVEERNPYKELQAMESDDTYVAPWLISDLNDVVTDRHWHVGETLLRLLF